MGDPAEVPVEQKPKEEKKPKEELPEVTKETIAAFGRTDGEYWSSPLNKILHLIRFLTIGPIRFVLIVGTLAIYSIVLRFFALINHCKLEDVQNQGGLARKWFLHGKKMSMDIVKFFGVDFSRRGDDSMVSEDGQHVARFVVSNHVSMIDIFALYSAGVPDSIPSFVSKAGVFDAIIMGTLLRVCRGIAVYRSVTGGTGTSQLLAQRAADTKEPPVAIFPEGTTNNGTCVCPFHAGAFTAGAPVKPICLKYSYTGFNPAYDVIEAVEWAYGILGSTGVKLEMIFLPVYVPSEEEKRDPRLYARNVRDLIAKELGFPAYETTFKEKLAYQVKYCNYKLKEKED